jgi:hypothetical protein
MEARKYNSQPKNKDDTSATTTPAGTTIFDCLDAATKG